MAALVDPGSIRLLSGNHSSRDAGVCLMEAVAWFANEPHSDSPACACPVLTAFGSRLNDSWADEERQLLRPLIPLLVGTRSTLAVERRRMFFLADRAVRLLAPMALDATGQTPLADELRALDPVVDRQTADQAHDVARSVRNRAYAYANADADAASAAYAYAYASAAHAYADAASSASAAYASAYASASAYAYAYAYASAAYAYADAAAAAAAAAYAAAYANANANAYAYAYAYAAAPKLSVAEQVARRAAARRPVIEASLEVFRQVIAITEAA